MFCLGRIRSSNIEHIECKRDNKEMSDVSRVEVGRLKSDTRTVNAWMIYVDEVR